MTSIMSAIMHTLAHTGTAVWFFMTCAFLVALIKKRNDVADVVWGLGFIVASLTAAITNHHYHARVIITVILVAIWGCRLSWHIYLRNRNKPEDRRYQAMRAAWQSWIIFKTYCYIFMLQGLLLLIIALPALWITTFSTQRLNVIDALGITVWIIGFILESISDRQLNDFLKNPANQGKILDTGLWRYSRHPNYFGEVTQWWGIYIIALSTNFGFLTILGPVTITWLILKVSGIPMLEKTMEQNPAFLEYKRKTSIFIPWPPQK